MAWELPTDPAAEADDQTLNVGATAPPAAPPVALPPTPADLVSMPDISGVLGPRPSVPMPVPPMPPNGQMDARQQLLHAIAAGVMLGLGPRQGAAVGIGQGVAQADAAAQAQKQKLFQYQQQDYLKQQAQAAATQKELDGLMVRREQQLQQTLLAFKKDIANVTQEKDYDALVQRYSSALQAAGYRISPQWFYQNMKFVPPTDQQALQKALDSMIKANKDSGGTPQMLFQNSVSYISPTTKQVVEMPFVEAMRTRGIVYKTDADGNVVGMPAEKGTAYDDAKARATAEYAAKFGHPPGRGDKAANDYISQRIGEFMAAQAKPPTSDFDTIVAQRNAERKAQGKPPLNSDELVALKQQTSAALGQVVIQPPGAPPAIVNVRTGEARPVTDRAGAPLAPRMTSTQVDQAEKKKEALNLLDQVDQAINDASAFIGPGAGRVSSIEQMVGNANPKVQALGTKLLLTKMRVDAAIGGMRAAASPQLLQRWDDLLGQKVTPEGLKASVQALREVIGADVNAAAPSAPAKPTHTINVGGITVTVSE